ncbi:hypothetical protein V1264_015000 [Littorina saxatilis]|uniref:WAP domain-containing protein n=1 Tax=Littorina saxatilis TaxID=31220 RepID=A0AAN9BKB9_9CAEN
MRAFILLGLAALVVVIHACPNDYSAVADPACETSTLTCQDDTDCAHGFQCCFGPNNACDASCYHPEHGHQPGNNHPGNPGNPHPGK